MIKVIRYLTGYLQIKIYGYAPERFINLCGNHGILLWDIVGFEEYYILKISVSDFRNIKGIVKKTNVKVVLLERYGLPFFIQRNKKRKIFWAGFPLCMIFLVYMTQFIWSIELIGNYQISDDILMDFMEDKKISYGTTLHTVDTEALELELRESYPTIIWVSVRIEGTKLVIDIKENDLLENISIKNDNLESYDLIAGQSGTIASIITRSGIPFVKEGDTIEAGEILISGSIPIYDNDGNIKDFNYVRADGDVYINTRLDIHDEIQRYYQYKNYSGLEKNKYFIEIGKNKFALNISKIPFLYYDVVEEKKQFVIFDNIYLPISLGKYTYRDYVKIDSVYSIEDGKKLIFDNFNQVMKTLEEKGVQILEKDVKIKVSDLKIGIYGYVSIITPQYTTCKIDTDNMEKHKTD